MPYTAISRLALAIVLAGATMAHAETAANGDTVPAFDAPRNGLEVRLGAGLSMAPTYRGAREMKVSAVPALSGGYGSRFDFDLMEGANLTLLEADGFSAGIAARWRGGRSSSDSHARLNGLRTFSDSFELGGFAAYDKGPLSLEATLTQDVVRAHGGAVLELRALAQGAFGPLGVSAGPQLRTVSRPYSSALYGIDQGEALASGLPAYQAKGGIESFGMVASAEWRLTGRTSLVGFANYERLTGSAARSPLVEGVGGSADQLELGVFLTYRLY